LEGSSRREGNLDRHKCHYKADQIVHLNRNASMKILNLCMVRSNVVEGVGDKSK